MHADRVQIVMATDDDKKYLLYGLQSKCLTSDHLKLT